MILEVSTESNLFLTLTYLEEYILYRCLWHKYSKLVPNPNLPAKIYDAQQRIHLRIYLKVHYITLFAGRIFCCDTGDTDK